jgi:hypothetical protein
MRAMRPQRPVMPVPTTPVSPISIFMSQRAILMFPLASGSGKRRRRGASDDDQPWRRAPEHQSQEGGKADRKIGR